MHIHDMSQTHESVQTTWVQSKILVDTAGFWMIWVFLFALLLSCGFWCRRRRNSRQVDYLVVRGPRDTYYNRGTPNGPPVYNGVPVYGTVGTTESGTPVVYGVYPPAGPIPNAPGQSMVCLPLLFSSLTG